MTRIEEGGSILIRGIGAIRGSLFLIQKLVQRRIPPGNAVFLGNLLEGLQVLLVVLVAGFLVVRVAVIDTAAERPWVAGSAQLVFLKRAEIRRRRLLVR